MNSRVGWFAALILCGIGCTTTSAPVTTSPADPVGVSAPDCGEPVDDEVVAWHGSKLLLRQTLVDPADGSSVQFEGVSWAMLSPDGTQTVALEYRESAEVLTIRSADGTVLLEEVAPRIVEAPELDPEEVDQLRRTRAFWWTDRELLVMQDLLPSEAYIDCKMLDVQTKQWRDVTTCPSGDMIQLADVTRGPGDLVSLLSAGEGHPAVDVVRWAPGKQQEDVGVPSFDLYPFGPLHVRFTNDPDEIYFETPCDLRQERGCMTKVSEEEDYSVFLFRWRRSTGLELVREGLPPAATFDPATGRWAWPTTVGVAVGDPDGDFSCVPHAWPRRT